MKNKEWPNFKNKKFKLVPKRDPIKELLKKFKIKSRVRVWSKIK